MNCPCRTCVFLREMAKNSTGERSEEVRRLADFHLQTAIRSGNYNAMLAVLGSLYRLSRKEQQHGNDNRAAD